MVNLLYIDDDADDRELMELIVSKKSHVQLVMAENGMLGLDYLESLHGQEDLLPSLILLDLNMPGLNGKEMFDRLRQDESLAKIPVAIFTSSSNPSDQEHFKGQNLVRFFTKPADLNTFDKILDEILRTVS